jgi:hypothetical protein
MTLVPSGATEKIGGYNPQQVKLAKGKPVALKKVPDMVSPLFGQIRFGGKTYFIAVDEPATKDAKLYVDANGNGDLTDDPEPKWEKKTGDGPNGVQLTQYSGKFELPLGAGDKAENVSFGAYRFDPNDTRRAQFKSTFLYYSDYAYEGDVTLNGAKYKAMLVDMSASGRTAGAAAAAEGAGDDADAKPAAAFASTSTSTATASSPSAAKSSRPTSPSTSKARPGRSRSPADRTVRRSRSPSPAAPSRRSRCRPTTRSARRSRRSRPAAWTARRSASPQTSRATSSCSTSGPPGASPAARKSPDL